MGRGHFGAWTIVWTDLVVGVHLMILHTKFQGFRPCGFRQDDFDLFKLPQCQPM